MQKAYDSVEWIYVEQVMRMMGFPEKYVNWVMTSISIVCYSNIVNGKPIKPFEAKRGLRQGDPLSPLLFVIAMEYLCRLLKQLGNNKNFKFHPRERRNLWWKFIISFKDSPKLLEEQWRATLIKSVLLTLRNYWAQVFILPKKIIQFIETICRRFLWTGNVEPTRKALIAWDKLCVPKSVGGLNFINIEIWNKAAISWEIWQKLLQWQGIMRGKKQWHEEVQWAVEKAAGKSVGAELYRITLAAVIYHVWQARNKSFAASGAQTFCVSRLQSHSRDREMEIGLGRILPYMNARPRLRTRSIVRFALRECDRSTVDA
uniref:Reverse transcriptase domain-containing protein n=1 Tax=Nicotiana tabacum TaxID=4097 RepID=A0A1S3YJI0_TOBAC|nr:PREDICTED: uncharacterized protein LOC107776838 [Nicotiana tabacum]